ncbi:hypothetical protein AA313_de0203538 [Arthrobotrys entomopaga]|nr:hypothetical protein AA313_de0203538 [Arthrobotrys entomopaga]
MFYARLTESAKRFGIPTEPKTRPEALKVQTNPDDQPILQKRIGQMGKPQNESYLEERYKKSNTETVALENALPKQNLTRPLDAEELLDLLNQTEEKLFYNMEEPSLPTNIKEDDRGVPIHIDDAANDGGTSLPDEIWTAEELSMKKRDRMKARNKSLNTPTVVDVPGEKEQSESLQEYDDSRKLLPRTAQTTPGLLSPDKDVKFQLRRPASFDTMRSGRESEKFIRARKLETPTFPFYKRAAYCSNPSCSYEEVTRVKHSSK